MRWKMRSSDVNRRRRWRRLIHLRGGKREKTARESDIGSGDLVSFYERSIPLHANPAAAEPPPHPPALVTQQEGRTRCP